MRSAGPITLDRPNLWNLYWLEARFELTKALRMPAYAIPTVAFPVLFYVLFALSFQPTGSPAPKMATYLLASYGTFGVIGAALFGFGVGVATERGQGWMLVKRATPMPPLAYFVAKVATAAVFGTAIVTLLAILGARFGSVELTALQWARLFVTLIGGTLPFAAIGLALGFVCGPNSAPAVVNLLYLPSAFASGLWIPLNMLPSFFQKLAPFLPPYHLGQLALKSVGMDAGVSSVQHCVALAIFSALSLLVAGRAYRRGGDKTYG